MNLQKTAYLLISFLSVVFILIYGQNILVPFILGVLLWFINRELKSALDRIAFIKNSFPNWLKNLLPFMIIVITIGLATNILTSNINALAHSLDRYEPNILALFKKINTYLNIDVYGKIKGFSAGIDFSNILRSLLASISDLLGNTFMILLYAVFVVLEESNFKPKLQAIFIEKDQMDKVDDILEKIGSSISRYFRLKAFLSLITGALSYVALCIIGVDAPEFWAFLIFILNFIPTIGSLIGTIFPAIFCLFQFGEFLPGIYVLTIVGIIQVLVGNVLEPKLMGSSMNISPLVTILSLSIWGAIWGITGMILSVPIAVVTIIVFSQFEKTKPVAIMLSEKGSIANIK